MAVRHWAIATLSAILLSVSAASYGQQQEKVTWAEAVGYVAQHGTAFSFYGPVAKTLGLSDGTTVDSRKLSKPGNPNRDFFVTENAVVLATKPEYFGLAEASADPIISGGLAPSWPRSTSFEPIKAAN